MRAEDDRFSVGVPRGRSRHRRAPRAPGGAIRHSRPSIASRAMVDPGAVCWAQTVYKRPASSWLRRAGSVGQRGLDLFWWGLLDAMLPPVRRRERVGEVRRHQGGRMHRKPSPTRSVRCRKVKWRLRDRGRIEARAAGRNRPGKIPSRSGPACDHVRPSLTPSRASRVLRVRPGQSREGAWRLSDMVTVPVGWVDSVSWDPRWLWVYGTFGDGAAR